MQHKAILFSFLILVSLLVPFVSADCNGNSTTCNGKNDTLTCSAQPGCYWTSTGNSDNGFNHLSLVIILIAFAALFVTIGINVDNSKWLTKSALYFASLLMMMITTNVGMQIAETSNLSKLMYNALLVGVITFSLFLAIIFINYIIQIVRAVRDSKKERETDLD